MGGTEDRAVGKGMLDGDLDDDDDDDDGQRCRFSLVVNGKKAGRQRQRGPKGLWGARDCTCSAWVQECLVFGLQTVVPTHRWMTMKM